MEPLYSSHIERSGTEPMHRAHHPITSSYPARTPLAPRHILLWCAPWMGSTTERMMTVENMTIKIKLSKLSSSAVRELVAAAIDTASRRKLRAELAERALALEEAKAKMARG